MNSRSDVGEERDGVLLFLCGDVMTGRGIDQIMAHSVKPRIYEPYVKDARRYVELAEAVSGPIPEKAGPAYIWGEGLDVLKDMAPDFRIINLETAVTDNEEYWPGKGINYRMHPKNIDCLSVAEIDCCVLANNHVLDWEEAGLKETLSTLRKAGIRFTGAGRNREEAWRPAVLGSSERDGRVLVYSFGFSSSGIPSQWAVGPEKPGVNFLPDYSRSTVEKVATRVRKEKKRGDVVVASVHWGGNWGYDVADRERDFACALIDKAGVDVFHGHSSHHFKGLEVYHGRPIIYGSGDLLNDYEGIGGHKGFRDDLCLMYFPMLDPVDGRLRQFTLTPMQIKRFQLRRPSEKDIAWVEAVLNRESRQFGSLVVDKGEGSLALKWE